MKKRKRGRKLSRKKDQRKALLRTLARSIFLNERIQTTIAKAKEVGPFVEKMINRAKSGDLASRRMLLKHFSSQVTRKIIDEIAPRYKERKGGYTRIIRMGARKSNGAKMAIIELVK